ncbi:MAG: FAD-binding protein, partial [Myxococcota bacterium]|nr:FAD-binding protein [Myxococcota bacterium]
TTPRIHTPCDDQGGEALVEILVDGLPFGVDVRLGTRVVDIEASGGQVGGVWIHGPGNGSGGSFDEGEFVFADRVVIATGGFSQREDWLDEVLTIETLDVSPSVGRGGDGVGLDWAMDHDWAVSDLSSLGFFALGFQDVDGVPVVLNSVHPRWLWVNEQGRRFADETETGSVRSTGEALGQLGAWVVMDSESFDDFNTGAYEAAESLVEAGLAARADTLGALAGHIGVDALTLLESLDTVAEGTDPDILRDREDGLVLDSPPYYGVRLLLGAVKNFGGLVLDEDSRVLDGQLEPIEGLYAAGEVSGMARPGVGGLWGWDGSLGAVIWSGWQAGESAASP